MIRETGSLFCHRWQLRQSVCCRNGIQWRNIILLHKTFTQLYILHAAVDRAVFPLVYALLLNKTETYNCFFSILKDTTERRQPVVAPEHWLMDFEITTRNSVNNSFPKTKTWRKVQSCGLKVTFHDDVDFHWLARRLAVLPIVPEHVVEGRRLMSGSGSGWKWWACHTPFQGLHNRDWNGRSFERLEPI